jgi:hypothetical protein
MAPNKNNISFFVLLSISFIFLNVLCKSNSVKKNDIVIGLIKKSNSQIKIQRIKNWQFNQSLKNFTVKNSQVNIYSDSFRIKLENKENISFKNITNKEDETSNVSFIYNGFDKTFGFHWISKVLYEVEKNILVNSKNGELFELWDKPIINKSRNFLVCKQNPCFLIYDDCVGGFQIWEKTNNDLKLFCQVDLKDHFVTNAIWKSDKILILETKGQINDTLRTIYELSLP